MSAKALAASGSDIEIQVTSKTLLFSDAPISAHSVRVPITVYIFISSNAQRLHTLSKMPMSAECF